MKTRQTRYRMRLDAALTAIIALLLFLLLQLSPWFPPLFCSVWSRSWRPTHCLWVTKGHTAVCSRCVTKGRRRLLLATFKFNGGRKGRALREGEHHQKVDAAGSTGALKGVVS